MGLIDSLDSHLAYYENGANDGRPTGTYGGHALKDGPTPRKDNREEERQSRKGGTKIGGSQQNMDTWLEEMKTWRKKTTAA
jgi:hypothetical protein